MRLNFWLPKKKQNMTDYHQIPNTGDNLTEKYPKISALHKLLLDKAPIQAPREPFKLEAYGTLKSFSTPEWAAATGQAVTVCNFNYFIDQYNNILLSPTISNAFNELVKVLQVFLKSKSLFTCFTN